mmetsp:Transcript_41278/g.90049  ORF Transcript_41278/g.90049 Transcript_41278/m.90049 type:complete len:367 (-) Transcript_41278:422-1522(-)
MGTSLGLVSGRFSTTRWVSSDCWAGRYSSPAAVPAVVQISAILASISASVSSLGRMPSSPISLKAGIWKTAPDRPGQFFIFISRSRTASRYWDPFSMAPHSSWVCSVVVVSFVRALSRSSRLAFSSVSSFWAFLTVSILVLRSSCNRGIWVARSSSTVSSQVLSLQVSPVSSTRSSMIKKLLRHVRSSSARSASHCSGEKVTVWSNLRSDSLAPPELWASIVVTGTAVVVSAGWLSCRAATAGLAPLFEIQLCSAREAVTTRRAAVAAAALLFNPSSCSCLPGCRAAWRITDWNSPIGVSGELPSCWSSWSSAEYISNCSQASSFLALHSARRLANCAVFLLIRCSRSLIISSSAEMASTRVVSLL